MKSKVLLLLTGFCLFVSQATIFSQEIAYKKNFGGSGSDSYLSVTAVPDGFVAAGSSGEVSFGNGDWTGVAGKGKDDAIIVKYDNTGNVVWKKNFGGSDYDYFSFVTAVSDGIIAVGGSYSSGTGDWTGITGKGNRDAIIVKYDHNGNVVWKRNFGGQDFDAYNSATAVSDGIIAVGESAYQSFGNGDWVGITGKGQGDAIIVKYTENSNGIASFRETGGSRIYPNPAGSYFFLKCETGNAIKIYDMLGKEVLSQSVNGKAEVNISHLPKGIYNVVILLSGKVTGNNKMVKL